MEFDSVNTILKSYEWQVDKNCFDWCIEQSIKADLSLGNNIVLLFGVLTILQYYLNTLEHERAKRLSKDINLFNIFLVIIYFVSVYKSNF